MRRGGPLEIRSVVGNFAQMARQGFWKLRQMPREETPFLMGQIGEKLLDLDRQVPAAIDQTAP